MKFEYDSNKSTINKAKHGISFEEIQVLWLSQCATLPAKQENEPRFMRIGRVGGKFYSCVYTMRAEDAVRFISARRSRQSEEEAYYEFIRT